MPCAPLGKRTQCITTLHVGGANPPTAPNTTKKRGKHEKTIPQKTKHHTTWLRLHPPTSPQTPHPQPQRRHPMPILRTTHVPRQTQKLGRLHPRSRPRNQTKRHNKQTPQPPHPPTPQNLQLPRRSTRTMGTPTHTTTTTKTKTKTQKIPMETINKT